MALKDHPKYAKYFKMLKMGLPLLAAQNKAQQDGVDPSVLERGPNEQVPLEEAGGAEEEMVALKDHPKYAKYFKMLKMGLPLLAAQNKAQQDGVDPSCSGERSQRAGAPRGGWWC